VEARPLQPSAGGSWQTLAVLRVGPKADDKTRRLEEGSRGSVAMVSTRWAALTSPGGLQSDPELLAAMELLCPDLKSPIVLVPGDRWARRVIEARRRRPGKRDCEVMKRRPRL
jgi:hypothetical protein